MEILHDKKQFYDRGTRPTTEADRSRKSDGHGNYVGVVEDERVHYHQSLAKGQNTATVAIARLCIRHLVENDYDPEAYLRTLAEYMTTPPKLDDDGQVANHNDTYLDIWVRGFFERASNGTPLAFCALSQRQSWSIGSLDGVVFVVPIVALYRKDPVNVVVARAIEHHSLTHKSITVSSGTAVLVPLLLELLQGAEAEPALLRAMEHIRLPAITGAQLKESYVHHRGPGNIPKATKWRQHMVYADESLADFARREISADLHDVAGWNVGQARLSTACYVEHALPIALYLAFRFKDDVKAALAANANLGGHSTARGAVLGAILGARLGLDRLPKDWIDDLADPNQVVHAEAKALATRKPPAL